MKVRSCEIVCQLEYLSQNKIEEVLNNKGCITEYAYILHDKDVYAEADEKINPEHKKGMIKPSHWHINLKFNDTQNSKYIAKWFGVQENFVNKHKGRWIDVLKYMVHKNAPEKYQYSSDEVISSFNYQQVINNDTTSSWKILRNEILDGKKTYQECLKTNRDIVNDHYEELRKAEAERLKRLSEQPMPKTKINIYIYGEGGTGKDTCAIAIAKKMFPDTKEDDLFFQIGGQNVSFDGYRGQPVIIWSDCRAIELIDKMGSRGEIFKVFDTHPKNLYQNIKYSKVKLINKVNIINSVQPFEDFVKGLVGEYEDKYGNYHYGEISQKNQVYRRFPIYINLKGYNLRDGYDVYLNKHLQDTASSWSEYTLSYHGNVSFGYAAENISDEFPETNGIRTKEEIFNIMVSPIEEIISQANKKISAPETDIKLEDEILTLIRPQ